MYPFSPVEYPDDTGDESHGSYQHSSGYQHQSTGRREQFHHPPETTRLVITNLCEIRITAVYM